MNKKIKIEIAVGIILMFAIGVGGIFYLSGTNKQAENNNLVKNKTSKSVLVKRSGDMNYVIYTDVYGNENIIDQASWNSDNAGKEKKSLSDYSTFSSAKFSPKENYILYKKNIYEDGDIVFLYDIANKKLIEVVNGDMVEFTPDEKYVYSCRYGFKFRGDLFSTGKVYKTTGFEEIYNVFGKTKDGSSQVDSNQKTEFFNGYRVKSCDYDGNRDGKGVQGVNFVLEGSENAKDLKEKFFELN